MTNVVNINDVLDGHVGLDLACIDRLYLNAYVPNLQVGGQVNRFLPPPRPAHRLTGGDREDREPLPPRDGRLRPENDVPILHLKKPDRSRWDDRKLDHVRPYMDEAAQAGRYGVVAIVSAQEFQYVFSATKKTKGKAVWFDWNKTERRVSCFYFYIHDREFGPGFIKICTYFPYPTKVWLNGHEWAKRQARRARISFTELANGFATCASPERLQAICDRFGPADVQGFFDRWITRIPIPLTSDDREAGYFWDLSMRQVEVCRTLVFDDPRRARGFFESLVSDNVGVGRPGEMSMVFARQVRKTTKEPFRTRIFGTGTEVKMDFAYKHIRVKQYLKEGRALRIETVINKPWDLSIRSRLEHLPELVEKARQVNDRLLMIERAGQGCAIGSALFERIHQPYIREGQRTGAFRFGDSRAMALAGALCVMVHAVNGFTNKSLRGLVAGLLGSDYSTNQMTYDLRRLRLHGLIIPGPAHQYLRRHVRRPAGGGLLHEAPRSPAATPARRRRSAGTRRASSRPGHDRPCCRGLRHERAPREGGMKLVTMSQVGAPE